MDRVKYQCNGVIYDNCFFGHFVEAVRPVFRAEFGCDIPQVPEVDLNNDKILAEYGQSSIVYEHYTGLVDQYCGGTNWTIEIRTDNFSSPGSGEPFSFNLYITDVAWSHTEISLRMSGERIVVEHFAEAVEPFLQAACRLKDHESLERTILAE